MSSKKTKTKTKSKAKSGSRSSAARKGAAKTKKKPGTPKPKARAKAKAKARPAKKTPTPARLPTPKKAAPVKAVRLAKAGRGKVSPAPEAQAAPAKPAPTPKPRSSRRSRRATLIRRGPDGEILAPGELLLPGGPKANEEIVYLFRGVMAAERPVPEEAVTEVFQKRGQPEAPGERDELLRAIEWARQRFEEGDIDPIIPARVNLRRTFQGVVDRARLRRREIGAFLRGLDMGRTETSHMDAHGEASLPGREPDRVRRVQPGPLRPVPPGPRPAREHDRGPDARCRADAPAPPRPRASLTRAGAVPWPTRSRSQATSTRS